MTGMLTQVKVMGSHTKYQICSSGVEQTNIFPPKGIVSCQGHFDMQTGEAVNRTNELMSHSAPLP